MTPTRGTLARRLVVGASALAVTGTLLAGPQLMPAAADPPLTITDAKAQIARLQTDAAAIDQEYVAASEELDAGRKKLKRKQSDVTAQTARVSKLRRQVGQVALAQFQNRSLDPTAQLLLTSDSDGFLSKVSTVEKVSENQNSVLQDFQTEQAALAALERSAEVDVGSLADQTTELSRLRAASDRKMTESEAVLKRLTAEEQRRIAAEEAAAAAKARAEAAAERLEAKASRSEDSDDSEAEDSQAAESAAEDAQADGSSADGSSADGSSAEEAPSGSSRGERAVSFAKSQLGKPYRFAAAGPSAYDCSGITLAAWSKAGVSLPRSSRTQFGAGRAVSRSELAPGDLVFFYSPISHVGIYVGNDRMIHSPRPGRTVEYTSVSSMPWAGARRPG